MRPLQESFGNLVLIFPTIPDLYLSPSPCEQEKYRGMDSDGEISERLPDILLRKQAQHHFLGTRYAF
jgi:hypothetical protein